MLKVSDLTLAYGKAEPVLDGVSLSVGAGEFVSLIGPSGCGKSTLLRVVTGLQKPTAGAVDVLAAQDKIGFLFQDNTLLPWRTARENVALGLRIRGVSKNEANARADDWLERMSLSGLGDRFPRELSGGQQKRVAIAQVFALEPEFLLMDEPFASLDAIVRRYITEDLLARVEAAHMTVLMVTHDLDEAIAVSDRVIMLGNGPRAKIKKELTIPIERPRQLAQIRQHPSYGNLTTELWSALSKEIRVPGRAS